MPNPRTNISPQIKHHGYLRVTERAVYKTCKEKIESKNENEHQSKCAENINNKNEHP